MIQINAEAKGLQEHTQLASYTISLKPHRVGAFLTPTQAHTVHQILIRSYFLTAESNSIQAHKGWICHGLQLCGIVCPRFKLRSVF